MKKSLASLIPNTYYLISDPIYEFEIPEVNVCPAVLPQIILP